MKPEDIKFELPIGVDPDRFQYLSEHWDLLRETFVMEYPDMILQMRWVKGLTEETGFANIAQHDVAAALVATSLHYITGCTEISEREMSMSMLDHNNIKAFRKMSESDWRKHFLSLPALSNHEVIVESIVSNLGNVETLTDHIFRHGKLGEILDFIRQKLEMLPLESRDAEYNKLISLTDYKPNEDILLSTEIPFHFPENFSHAALHMMIGYFADDSAEHNTVVEARRRIEEVAARNSKLDHDSELTMQLGMKYWDSEREHIAVARDAIIHRATENEWNIEDPELLAFYALQYYAKHLFG